MYVQGGHKCFYWESNQRRGIWEAIAPSAKFLGAPKNCLKKNYNIKKEKAYPCYYGKGTVF